MSIRGSKVITLKRVMKKNLMANIQIENTIITKPMMEKQNKTWYKCATWTM